MNSSYTLDIILTILLTLLCAIFVLNPQINNNVLITIFSLILVLFVPGYSLTAALFPKKNVIDGLERIVLSFGFSIAFAPLISVSLNYTPLGIRLQPIIISLTIFIVSMSIIAYIRRSKLSENERFNIDYHYYFNSILQSFKKESGKDKILSITLVIFIIFAVITTAYAMVIPKEGEKFTEFYILGSNGNVTNYPTNLTAGQTGNVTVEVVNHEYSTVNYKIIVKLDNQTISNKSITLSSNQRYEEPFTFVTYRYGQNRELEFLLYKLPDENNVYRSLHLWINVG